MEWMLILRVLLRRWWLIVLPVAVAAVVAVPQLLRQETSPAAGGFATTFKYSAAQQLNLPQRDGDYQDVWLASELVVNAFTDWVRSSTFRQELSTLVTDEVDLSRLGIAADNDRSIGVVQMSYPDADVLAKIAAAAIEVLQTRSQAYFPHLAGTPAQVTLVDAPTVVPNPPPLTNRFAPILQLGVALFAGLGLAFLAEYLDPTLRRSEDLEAQGFIVLANVPEK
jgi:capsular polysaccharide biosynthesis protein